MASSLTKESGNSQRPKRTPGARAMADSSDSGLIIGEMRGQLREVVHSVNNLSAKFDGLSREVMAWAALAGERGKLQAKVEILEGDRNRRDGATGLLGMIVKSPAFAYVGTLALGAWAVISGKLHL